MQSEILALPYVAFIIIKERIRCLGCSTPWREFGFRSKWMSGFRHASWKNSRLFPTKGGGNSSFSTSDTWTWTCNYIYKQHFLLHLPTWTNCRCQDALKTLKMLLCSSGYKKQKVSFFGELFLWDCSATFNWFNRGGVIEIATLKEMEQTGEEKGGERGREGGRAQRERVSFGV